MTIADKINAALDANKTVTVATYLRAVAVRAKHRAAWASAGYEFFKTAADGATLMIDGQSKGKPRYVIIDGAKITAA